MIPRIRFHYTITLKDGTSVESTIGEETVVFIAGQNEIMPALEHGMIGMKSGESKKIFINAKDGYDHWQKPALQEVTKSQFPQEAPFKTGMQLAAEDIHGNITPVTITEIRDNSLIVNFKHPLADQDLCFDITIVDIELVAPPESLNPFIDAHLTEDFDFDRELESLSDSAKEHLHSLQPSLKNISSTIERLIPKGVLGYMLVPNTADNFTKPTLYCLLDDTLAGDINLDKISTKMSIDPKEATLNIIALSALRQSLMEKQTDTFDLFANAIIFRDYVALLAILRHCCLYRNLLRQTFKEHLLACFALGAWLDSPDYYNVDMVVVVDTCDPEHSLVSAQKHCQILSDQLCGLTHVYQDQRCYASSTFWDDIAKEPNDMIQQLQAGLPFYIK